jgi:magnesium chelatase subunit I
MVFSANPEDYTNRGNIITPLKDRIASQILTHYPPDAKTASAITDQESWTERETHGVTVLLGDEVKLLVEEIAFVARRSELVDQSSGVSARLAIAARELLVSNLERRALRTGESVVAPRLVDFFATLPAITGKVEMVFEGEQQGAEIVAKKLIGDAVKTLFESHFPPVEGPRTRAERPRRRDFDDEEGGGPMTLERAESRRQTAPAPPAGPYDAIAAWFSDGRKIVLSDQSPFSEHLKTLECVTGLSDFVLKHARPRDHFERAFLMELVLEGLVQNLRIAREDLDSTITFQELMKFNVLRTVK